MSFEELYEHLEKFVHYLSHEKANGAFLMDAEEIAGELFVEMVRGYQQYGHLPEGELLAVVRKMMDNKISDLVYRYYVTHRKHNNSAFSLSSGSVDRGYKVDNSNRGEALDQLLYRATWTSCPAPSNLEEIIDSKERVDETFEALSKSARRVLFALLYGCPGVTSQVELSGKRASHIFKVPNRPVKIKPWHVAEALDMEETEVRRAFLEIREAYEEIVDAV